MVGLIFGTPVVAVGLEEGTSWGRPACETQTTVPQAVSCSQELIEGMELTSQSQTTDHQPLPSA